jgi:Spy/CpxP family protein refolding chaperone
MKNAIRSSLLILALTTSAAFAQMGPPPGDSAEHMQHHLTMLTKHLELTPAQQQQATALLTNAAGAQTTLHNNMKAAHESLQAAIKANDTAAIDQAATNIGNLTAQSISAHAKAHAAFLQILTPEQQAKMAQFESQHEHFGPGGMHGFHGPPTGHSSKPE